MLTPLLTAKPESKEDDGDPQKQARKMMLEALWGRFKAKLLERFPKKLNSSSGTPCFSHGYLAQLSAQW